MPAAPTIATLARRIRHADWWAHMSDDSRVWRRHDADVAEMKDLVSHLGTKAASRVWELGTKASVLDDTWDRPSISDEEMVRYTGTDRAARYELGWRWAGAYCWAHGVRLTEAEAQALVGRPGSGRSGVVDWKAVDALVR